MLTTRLALAALLASLVLGSAACINTDPVTEVDPATIAYAPELGVNISEMVETPERLYYQDLVVGTGETAVAGDSVRVNYRLWLSNGAPIDSAVAAPPTVNLVGAIAGWQLGVPGMRERGTRKLVVRPLLGYGLGPSGPVPGNSVLVFDVTLVEVLPR